MRRVAQETDAHRRSSNLSCFYVLTRYAYLTLCRCVYQVSLCLATEDLTMSPAFELNLCFYCLMFLIYYGVEHYITSMPKRLADLPRYALHLSFTKGLNRLGYVLARRTDPIVPGRVYRPGSFPSGANTITIEYGVSSDTSNYYGGPLSKPRRHVLECRIIVDEYGLLPVVNYETRQAYLNDTSFDAVHRERSKVLTFPATRDTTGATTWITPAVPPN